MSNFDRKTSKIVKKDEMRTKEIPKMISEGGLGSENYYNIEKLYRDAPLESYRQAVY